MRRRLVPAVVAACLRGGAAAQEPDDIWTGGAVYTADGSFSVAQALAVREGRIAAIGSDSDVRKLAGPRTRLHDLGGRCVTPGLIDAHCHVGSLGSYSAGWLDLHDTRSLAEAAARVKEAASRAGPGEWVLGGRWDQSLWGENGFPTHERLSEAAPDVPVWLERVDGHAAIANRKAMALAGIGRDTKSPPGGEVVRGASGEPTGVFLDNALSLVARSIPGGRRSAADLILLAQAKCLAAGLTAVHDASIGLADAEAYRKLEAEGKLKLRVYGMVSGSVGPEWLRKNRPAAGDRFSLRAVKLFADGAMGSWGAWLLEPYADRQRDSDGRPYTGLPVEPPERIREMARAALEGGWQAATHAIGDRAIRETLDAYEAALRERPVKDHRFRIEHAQAPAAGDIPRFAALGVIPSMQPSHATSDMRWAEARVGPERVKTAYAWRSFLRAGCRIAAGSDFPVEGESPLRGILAAVTREDERGNPPGGWMPAEVMTREEALRAFTIDAAYSAFEEGRLGSLEAGKAADFVVWSRDVLRCAPRELLTAAPVEVVIGGETVHRAQSDDAWVEPMRIVRARFRGKPGTLAQLGDSITVTMAYWTPLREARRNAPPALEEALRRVEARLRPECWRGWKGPEFGSDGGKTARWALENVDRWLRELDPEVALVMFGTNDLGSVNASEYRADLRRLVERCLSNGTVVILSTIPPRSGFVEKSAAFAEAAREVARELSVPLIDFHAECLRRRPLDWDGSAEAFKAFKGYDAPTLLSRDGVHPSFPAKHRDDYSEEGLRSSGYTLRSYLSLLRYDEVVRGIEAPLLEPPSEAWFPRPPPLPEPAGPRVLVSDAESLFREAAAAKPGTTILIADGRYDLPRRLELRADRLALRGASGRRERVVLDGGQAGLGELVSIHRSDGILIADLTIQNARWNGFKVNSEEGVHRLTIRNCIIHDIWQRGVKGVAVPEKDRERLRPTGCRVEYCLFYNDRPKEYYDDPADRPDNFRGNYIGGIDVMYARDWTVSDNVFVGIQGRTREARGAVFMWHESEGCTVERNVIVDCDQGICMGNSYLPQGIGAHARRCVVRNNFITRAHEGGIVCDHSSGLRVLQNTVHDPRSPLGRLIRVVNRNDGLVVSQNLLSGPDVRVETSDRSGMDLLRNVARDLTAAFSDPGRGNLRLKGAVEGVTGAGQRLREAPEDIDRARRGERTAIGAHETPARPGSK